MIEHKVEIYQSADSEVQLHVNLDNDTVWLTQAQMVKLFASSKANISEHISHILETGELETEATVRKFRTVQIEGDREVTRSLTHYNLDMIISVGYRVNTKRGIQFRQWATQRLKDYLVQGYAINTRRLEQKQQEVQVLRDGVRILSRAIEEKTEGENEAWLAMFSKGLALLDDYDHEALDAKGISMQPAQYPAMQEYRQLIEVMKADFDSEVGNFAEASLRGKTVNNWKSIFKELINTSLSVEIGITPFSCKRSPFIYTKSCFPVNVHRSFIQKAVSL